jgi:hypothetical protein
MAFPWQSPKAASDNWLGHWPRELPRDFPVRTPMSGLFFQKNCPGLAESEVKLQLTNVCTVKLLLTHTSRRSRNRYTLTTHTQKKNNIVRLVQYYLCTSILCTESYHNSPLSRSSCDVHGPCTIDKIRPPSQTMSAFRLPSFATQSLQVDLNLIFPFHIICIFILSLTLFIR